MGKVVDRTIELRSEREADESGREMVDVLIKPKAKREVSNIRREQVDWLIEHFPCVREKVGAFVSKREVGDTPR